MVGRWRFRRLKRSATSTPMPPCGFTCFTSLAEERLDVQWGAGRTYQSQEPGIAFQPVPDAPEVAGQAFQRQRQLRELARNFTARVLINPRTNNSQEMRLLTTPIWEFQTGDGPERPGAVFAFSTNGTNPDLVVIVEARPVAGRLVWSYAPARLTTGGLTVFYRDQMAWEAPFVQPHSNVYPTWTFFSTARTPIESE